MPNNITNRLTVPGTDEEVKQVLDFIQGGPDKDTKEPCYIDFNKIIPMPEELHITVDGLVSMLENRFSMTEPVTELIKRLREAGSKSVGNFCKAVKNVATYGYACWYDWAVAHWGTKWNAYSTGRDGNTVAFNTAWSAPISVLEVLSRKFPRIRFEHTYADEDIGYNCGAGFLENGKYTKITEFEFGSQEAKDFASEIKGYPSEEDEVV